MFSQNFDKTFNMTRGGVYIPSVSVPQSYRKVSTKITESVEEAPKSEGVQFGEAVPLPDRTWQVTEITLLENQSCFKAGRTVYIRGKNLDLTTEVFIQNLPHTPKTPVSYNIISKQEIRFTVPFNQQPLQSGQNFMGVFVKGPEGEEFSASFPTDLLIGGNGTVVAMSVSDYFYENRSPWVGADAGTIFEAVIRIDVDDKVSDTFFDIRNREQYYLLGTFMPARNDAFIRTYNYSQPPDEWGDYPSTLQRIEPRLPITIEGREVIFYTFPNGQLLRKNVQEIVSLTTLGGGVRYRAGDEVGGDAQVPFNVSFYTLMSSAGLLTVSKHTINVTQADAYNPLNKVLLQTRQTPQIPPQVIACAD